MSVWLAHMVKALPALTHVRSSVQEVRVQSPEQTSSTPASIPPGWVKRGAVIIIIIIAPLTIVNEDQWED